jgi:hypothetical protein
VKKELTIADLRPAAYNPRLITPTQKLALRDSYLKYGDLSGITFNTTTGNLVGGHQRCELFKKSSRVVRNAHKDSMGTVAVGHVEVPGKDGKTLKIPYREVAWTVDVEMAANIAANAAGGSFDQVKLGKIIKRLEKHKFPIESIPIDSIELSRAIRTFEYLNRDNDKTVPVSGHLRRIAKADMSEHWQGMPEYEHKDMMAHRKIIVNFASDDDVAKFAARIGQKIGPNERSIWFPPARIDTYADKCYTAQPAVRRVASRKQG